MTSAPTLPAGASAGEAALAQLHAARELIAAAGSGLVSVNSGELTDLAIAAAGVVAAAEAARAGIVLEASIRGVMASSDYPRTRAWVEETCREAEVPVTSGAAKQLQDITTTCVGFDVTALREAVTTGELSVEAAATAAGIFRRLKNQVHCENWDQFARDLITWIGLGPSKKDLVTFEERIIGQYGTGPEPLEKEHVEKYYRRGFTQFRTTRD
ncbi:MAG: hypothetical protein Q4G43_10605, partial [Mobilicoccus sp.]|nr:hypothetical protein [Mobilicoccus sp.]